MIPGTLSIYPVPFPGPDDPAERTDELCAAIRRFAPFEPEVVLVLAGRTRPRAADPAEARRVIVEGFRKAARVAAEHGLTLGMEPLHRDVYGTWTTVYTIPETIALMDEIGEPNVQVLYDVYHLWDTDDVLGDTVKYGEPHLAVDPHLRLARRDPQRLRPGAARRRDHRPAGHLRRARRRRRSRWVDLEIFSDDGSFTDKDFEDSLWKQDPADVLARAKAGFDAAWEARRPPA